MQNAHFLLIPTLLMIFNHGFIYDGRVLTCILDAGGKSANLPVAFSL